MGVPAQLRCQHGQLVESVFLIGVQDCVFRSAHSLAASVDGTGGDRKAAMVRQASVGWPAVYRQWSVEKFTSMEWPGPRQGGMDKLGGTGVNATP